MQVGKSKCTIRMVVDACGEAYRVWRRVRDRTVGNVTKNRGMSTEVNRVLKR